MKCRTCNTRYARRFHTCPTCGAQADAAITGKTDRLPVITPQKPLPTPIPWLVVLLLVGAVCLSILLWLYWWPLQPLPTIGRRGSTEPHFFTFYEMIVANLIGLYTLRSGYWWQRIACLIAVIGGWIVRWYMH